MIRKLCIPILFLMSIQLSFAQEVSIFQDSISANFNEIKIEADKHKQLWGKDLYGPMLLVDPDTRQIFANFSDSTGILKQDGKIYSGILPAEINIANTAVNWNGRRWAMIMLPLPVNKQDRINLLAHELFHVSQPLLGFQLFNVENNHLDEKNGRIYLRLELEALKKALQAHNETERKTYLTHALTFRKYRYLLYPGAYITENLLELNEGIAEYTGSVISGRDRKQSSEHFIESINSFLSNPTFVRSFAYQTTPVYGYLLNNTKKGWNREITVKTNLTEYFIKAFNITLPNDLRKATALILHQYNGKAIISEEEARENKTKKLIAEYKSKFITQPHFELVFEKMNVSFDPRNIIPIEDKGTVYPNIRVTDKWGILTVENGALMSSKWDKILVTSPLKIENKIITGEGWLLELNDGYSVIKDEVTGNYKLTKKRETTNIKYQK
ncbi:hypothetical protein [Chryseobacterium daecheongense]|uniref:Uncharacterized protein n=1 Tax=Chryseobacterium daecheongense TaxID=192389 RepID=A0A3N0VY27_9FLAO|nr:hypothetical protein [Chryseobacterium daecheongense]ROH97706.1 hypothetical protein EGI05_10030 [Chryseobacterium daecheongense]TDX93133.1 hypothetical protein BCF50_2090 [Chryseobacterium daecheongense]